MDDMAPSTDVTSNSDVWAHPGIQWSCNRIDSNAVLGIQSALTTVEGTNNNSSSFTASSTRIAPAATHNQAAVTDPSSPSYTRFRKLFQKLKRALCEFVETILYIVIELDVSVHCVYVYNSRCVFSVGVTFLNL